MTLFVVDIMRIVLGGSDECHGENIESLLSLIVYNIVILIFLK
jgi:hypothetical protein